jgi:ABC-2 type transport system permease protein
MQAVGRSLRSVWIIYKQELNLYFLSPLVYLVGAVWLFLSGGFFSLLLVGINQGYSAPDVGPMLSTMYFLMIFVAPALTMRVISEEIRTGTHELLFTAPVRDWEIIVAKWLAVWTVFTVYVVIMIIYPFILKTHGTIEMGTVYTGYLGLWLLGGATLALGVFASSLSQYQLVAFLITMGALIFLWLTNSINQLINNTTIADVMSELSITSHFNNLISRALIDPVDLAYFIGLIVIFLFLATQALNTRRWSA